MSNNEGNGMSKVELNISTPLEFMKLIEASKEQYEMVLSSPELTDEDRTRIRSNKESFMDNLNSKFLIFLKDYTKHLIEAVLATSLVGKRELDNEVENVVKIYREYFHNNELADGLENEYKNASLISDGLEFELEFSDKKGSGKDDFDVDGISSSNLRDDGGILIEEVETSEVQDIIDLLDKTLNMIENEDDFFDSDNLDGEIKHLSDIMQKVHLLKAGLRQDDNIDIICEKEARVAEFIASLKNRKILSIDEEEASTPSPDDVEVIESIVTSDAKDDNPLDVEVLSELDSFDDYSNLSNNELLDRVHGLVGQIKKAQLEKSDDLKGLLLEASRVQAELDSRLSSKNNIKTHKNGHLVNNLGSDTDKIRRAKHFKQEDKDRMISDLYDDSYGGINSPIRR